MATAIEPPSAAHVFPVTMPTEHIESREKLRSSSWTCPVSLTSRYVGAEVSTIVESGDGFNAFSCDTGVESTEDDILQAEGKNE